MKIPLSIARYIRSIWTAKLFVSYLHLDAHYSLIACGGYLHHYGLPDLVIGQPAIPQIDFLTDLLPIYQIQVIEFIKINNGCSAHIHVVPLQGEIWVLLFDATAEYEQKQAFRQKANELNLLVNAQSDRIQQLEQAHTVLLEEKSRLEHALEHFNTRLHTR